MSNFYIRNEIPNKGFEVHDTRYTDDSGIAYIYTSTYTGEVLINIGEEVGLTISELQEIVDMAREFRDRDIPIYE